MTGRGALLFLAAAWLGQALAQGQLEIIPLKHRTVEQVMPVLLPLVEPGGTLSGMQNQLFVRTGPKNLAELKQVLANIDTPLRRLLISVRQQSAEGGERRSASVSGTVGGGRIAIGNEPGAVGTRGATVRLEDVRGAGDGQIVQQVQALEGSPAMIQIGQSVPLTSRTTTTGPGGTTVRESTSYGEVGSGFEVVARIAGDRAILEISPRRETLAAGSGAINFQRVVSTASGKLGEWFELGGITQGESRRNSGIASRSGGELRGSAAVWVKVEEIR